MNKHRSIPMLLLTLFLFAACYTRTEMKSVQVLKEEIHSTEEAFRNAATTDGIAEAFYRFADSAAVINRGRDSLIFGKDNIKHFYDRPVYLQATVDWAPDFIDVSESGDLAYSYGKYHWQVKDSTGKVTEYRGVYMTVWKRQKDGNWKYVWD